MLSDFFDYGLIVLPVVALLVAITIQLIGYAFTKKEKDHDHDKL